MTIGSRRYGALAALLALAACSGGGGGPAATVPVTPGASGGTSTTPQSGLVAPTFTLVILAPAASSAAKKRKPNFISKGTLSVTITLTSVNGSPPTISPSTVTTNINGTSGNSCATGCTVSGPPSPPGVADAYTITTYDSVGGASGTGHALDIATPTFTPAIGQSNAETVTLEGIPVSVSIVANALPADTQNQSETLTVAALDYDGNPITGSYATTTGTAATIQLDDPDTAQYGTSLSGTVSGGGCTGSCLELSSSTDAAAATLDYGGLAENPVTLTATGTGITTSTGAFTPALKPIVYTSGSGPVNAASQPEIDLFTTDSTSASGYRGSESFSEAGFTDAPYFGTLGVTGATSCSSFATINAAFNIFTASAVAGAVAGSCTLTVADGLTDQTNALPTITVTYTTSSVGTNAKHRVR